MTDWSRIVPEPCPEPIKEATQAVSDVGMALRAQRERLDMAKQRVVELQQADRLKMSEQIRRGADPTSNTAAISKAEGDVRVAERRVEAAQLAAAESEAMLGVQLVELRSSWATQAAEDQEQARAAGLEALTALEAALRAMSSAATIEQWLSPNGGMDRNKPAKVGLLPTLSASRSTSANGTPVDPAAVLSWLHDALDPPAAKPTAPANPVKLQPSLSH